jgi:L-ascorbate metabolism protein UlaG (beta-lactamase superfamily)
MALTITFLGHAGFAFEDGAHTLLVDPFLTGNPAAVRRAADLRPDWIGLTHGHSDHLGDTVALAGRGNATVIATFEVCAYLEAQGVTRVEPGNPGGRIATPFGWVAFTQAFHSSSIEGRYLGVACGLVIRMGDVTVYHCGDTGLFGDMALIGDVYRPDIACIPIGDRYTMGPELATRAAELIKPTTAIPMHYDTWPPIAQDPSRFAPRGVAVRLMAPGDTWRVEDGRAVGRSGGQSR